MSDESLSPAMIAVMATLFHDPDRAAILDRLERLSADAVRQWGKMDPAQMLCHCVRALEVPTGVRPTKQALLGKLLGPFVRGSMLGDAPFRHDSPTDPALVVSDPCDFAREQDRLRALVDRFAQGGPEQAGQYVHSFFGKLTGEQWGGLMYKHLDHHLTQFGA